MDSQNVLGKKERDTLLADNERLNNEIKKLYLTVDQVKTGALASQDYNFPWSNKSTGLGAPTVVNLPSANLTQRFMDKPPMNDFDDVSISTVDQTGAPQFSEFQNESVFFPTSLPPLNTFYSILHTKDRISN